MNIIKGLFNFIFTIIKGIFNIIFHILDAFLGNKGNDGATNYNVSPLEQERISRLNENKNELYNNMYNQAYSQIKEDYLNNKKSSTITFNQRYIVFSNVDISEQNKIALKATYDAAANLGIKISAESRGWGGIVVNVKW